MNAPEATRIRKWIERVAKEHRSLDEIHIDEVNRSFRKRVCWAFGGTKCFKTAVLIRDQLDAPFAVALAFSLQSSQFLKGINFTSIDELINECDDTPPSLYLFGRNNQMWRETPKTKVPWSLLRTGPRQAHFFYVEYQDASDPDYRRSFWIIAPYSPARRMPRRLIN